MQLMWIFFIFLFGISIGSFVNVVIYRTLNEESFVKGRSRCDHCKRQIAWYDNIPLLSYVLLGGKCRNCKKKISIQHPIVELMTGILFVWWYAVGFAFFHLTTHPLLYVQPVYWLVVGILLLIVLITDLTTYLIPTFAVVLLGGFAFLYRLLLVKMGVMVPGDLWLAVLSGMGLSAFFGFLVWVTKGRGMGLGDVELAMALGLLLGWPRSLIAIFLAFLMGALVGIGMVFAKKKSFGQALPFGPFLVAGTVIALVWGYDVWLWYLGMMV